LKELFTKAKFYLVNSSNPAKTEKSHKSVVPEQEINSVQIPHPSMVTFKFPPSQAHYAQSNPWGMPGGGCLSFNLTGTLVLLKTVLVKL